MSTKQYLIYFLTNVFKVSGCYLFVSLSSKLLRRVFTVVTLIYPRRSKLPDPTRIYVLDQVTVRQTPGKQLL